MKDNLQFRDTIHQLMDSIGNMSESELARQTGLPQQTVHRLLSGATPDPRVSTLKPIASYFKVTIGQLIGDEPISPKHANEKGSQYVQIPLLQWEQVETNDKVVSQLTRANWMDWAITKLHVSEKAYALKINDKSLPPPFSYDATIIVDPGADIMDSDIIVVFDEETRSAYLRRLIIDGKKRYLVSLKEGIPNTEIQTGAKLCGVVVESQATLKELKGQLG